LNTWSGSTVEAPNRRTGNDGKGRDSWVTISTDAIYAIIEKEGIAVEWAHFTAGILAVYTRRPHWRRPVITLSTLVLGNERLERSLLLEGLGHHKTARASHADVRTYADRVAYTKAERAALRVAVEIACPEHTFRRLAWRYY